MFHIHFLCSPSIYFPKDGYFKRVQNQVREKKTGNNMVMTVSHKVNMTFSFKFSTKDLVLARLPHQHSKLRKFITLSK